MKTLRAFVQKINQDEIWNVSAQLAYYILLSFFPLLIAIVSLLDLFPAGVDLLMKELETVMPNLAFRFISENRAVFSGLKGGMFSIGFVSSLWVSTKGSKAIYRSLNKSYGEKATDRRSFAVYYLISFCITLSMIFFILLSLTAILLSNRIIMRYIHNSDILFFISQIRIWIMFAVLILVLAVLYKAVPRTHLKFRNVIFGTVAAALLWILCTVGFELYVNNFGRYTVVYGTLGSIVVLLLWLYMICFSLLFGNEINAFLYQEKPEFPKPGSRKK